MLLSLLSVAGLLLGSCAASPPLSDSHQIVLPTADCAFADENCKQTIHSRTYLTLNFAVENNTLFANGNAIFPPSLPMQLQAPRTWISGSKPVSVSYALDARPLPSAEGEGALKGEIYLLKLKLFDPLARPASNHLVTIGLSKDSAGELAIAEVETDPLRHRQHHGGPPPPPHHRPSWMTQLTSKLEATKNCLHGEFAGHRHHHGPPPPPPHHHQRPDDHDHHPDPHRTIAPIPHGPPPHHHHHHGGPGGYWHGNEQDFVRLLRPVVAPALLGVFAGVIACMLGFVLGKTIISMYYCFSGRKDRARMLVPLIRIENADDVPAERDDSNRDVEREMQEDIDREMVLGVASEKERLLFGRD